MAKIIFLDLETTGFSRDYDYIIEVAAILYDEETRTKLDTFHEYIRPGKRIPQKITEITGISEAMVVNCRTEEEVLRDFFEWVMFNKPDRMTAYNSSFDSGFIEAKRDKYRIPMKTYDWFDMMTYGRQLKKEGKTINYKQTTVAEFLGIEYDAHSAIEDVTALIQIYEKLGLNKNKKSEREKLGF